MLTATAAHRSTAETKDSAKFNIDVARWLLLVSGIMYERDTNKALEATKAYYESQDDHSLSFAGLRTQEDIKNFVRSKQGDKDETFSMVSSNGNYHFRPESRIEQQTRIWDVHFRPISHMKRLYSPFAGIWWNSGQDPFIIVAFKGTTPVDYSEFLVDASFQKTDASAFLWGNCHQGDAYDSSLHGGGNEESPYGSLIQAIRIKAKELHAAIKEKYPYIKIPVYVTGHSLGAAMASLFYARLLKAPHDLGPLVDIRQAYVYGCPAVGDVEFAQGFASEINSSYSNHFGLWRVIDDSDIVTRLPLNFSNPLSGRPSRNPFVKHGSLVDYCVIGNGVRVFGDGREPQVCWKMPRSANVFEMSDPTTAPLRNPFKGVINWAKKFIHGGNAMRVELACPKPISRDHFPTEYFRNLSKSENYFKFHDELFAK
ncbi:Phospholipase A1-II 1 [Neolecta irregularis DAH-3]|uniref:Phospholipase A1-II 1 n=1 Tax=Neolecta irregularis (strain DAH-3) TaxID=1198029 RepID=A0A1U7LN16_NEOID|nr:Phospholipase A1-II 1 [Neolecta irregularis DAH-3]|eukprot:OLL24018.1 Phospholipase A1-II 1 [Neolecta irregularis DAH-3]